MTQTIRPPTSIVRRGTPTDRLLTASLVLAPLVYLAADTVYAVRGWTDATAGVLHVLGAIAYGLVVVRIATWLPDESRLAAWLFATAVAGSIGNAAYGFDTIHQSFGDVALVDRGGAAILIKVVGLLFPLSLALAAWALLRLQHREVALLISVAAAAWPVAHIANIGALAVVANVLLVTAFGSLAWGLRAAEPPTRGSPV